MGMDLKRVEKNKWKVDEKKNMNEIFIAAFIYFGTKFMQIEKCFGVFHITLNFAL